MWQSFPLESLLGGMLLGISASLLLLFNGKIAGISGILAGLWAKNAPLNERAWRWLFVLGMVAGGWFATVFWQDSLFLQNTLPQSFSSSTLTLIAAGLLVGVGTKMGNGCTSGHGICGIGRLSVRSVVATVTFMAVAAVTVYFRLHVFA